MSDPAIPQAPRVTHFAHRHPPQSIEGHAFTRMVKRDLSGGPDGPIACAATPYTQTPIIRWSATIEANGAAVLRVDQEGISIVANIQDYASVLWSSANHLLSIVGAEGTNRASVSSSFHVNTRVPAAWKTTEPSVSVRLTDDFSLAKHWRASGFQVVELFD
ncbi:MAG: hypothetical protein AB1704_20235 [Pseudomonadota bacterium]